MLDSEKKISWVRLYNLLFQIINIQSTKNYFSGSRFINIIREFNEHFPSYNQFIQERKAGESTSRKDYFYDIFLLFTEIERINIIVRILEEIEVDSVNKEALYEIRKAIAIVKNNDSYDTVFISYGANDEMIAAEINSYLKSQGIKTWFFPEDALIGEKLHRMMHNGVNNHNKVLLICSEQSLKREGLLNELERILERETREGGSEILLPITLDDYVYTWMPEKQDLAEQVRSRVIIKLSREQPRSEFNLQLDKIILALASYK